ncbi:hypothetical protein BDF20DRAFT_890997 [Mycotypha africana]|uniref:uncharacterized protein n=1 Tax=Mycotypha africana TaxID=64632 RepID=UPI0022FFD95E|nr:uncharacterized protein BDF20DRAFT_890997 [Mycotypha africana]KAI8970394.1 hypothetical protein BDF20DRAFT_890997 [Mycotypha africana]
MEDNNTPEAPSPCTAGCGFYGNKIYNNMCSKCFKEHEAQNKMDIVHTATSNNNTTTTSTPKMKVIETPNLLISTPSATATATATTNTNVAASALTTPPPQEALKDKVIEDSAAAIAITETAPQKPKEDTNDDKDAPKKPVQKNKGRCFECRSKIPLAKQLTNKCRCDYIFCDTHRFPDKHHCTFDHAKNDKDILAKLNPKINDKPRGGNSFQRIDSF